MDVTRFLVRTKYSMVLIETLNMEINDNIYRIKMVDDMHEPKHIVIPKEVEGGGSHENSSSEEDEDDGVW